MAKEKEFYSNFLSSKRLSKEFSFDQIKYELKQENDSILLAPDSKNINSNDEYTCQEIQTPNIYIKEFDNLEVDVPPVQFDSFIRITETTKKTVKMFVDKLKELTKLRKTAENSQSILENLQDKAYISTREKKSSRKAKIFVYMQSLRLFVLLKKRVHSLIKKNNFIIHPYNNFKIFWDLIQFFIMTFFFFYLPLDIIHQDKNSQTIRSSLSIMMLIDSCLGFRTAYFLHGKLITDSSMIFKGCVLSFVCDVFTQISLCYDLFLPDFSSANLQTRPIKLIFLVRYRKFLFIYQTLIDRFRIDMKFGFLLDFLNLLATSICIMHWVACGWFAIGMYSGEENTWLSLSLPKGKNFIDKYFCAFYWAAVTMMTVGYGDITPQNQSEKMFATLVVVIGCGLFAYYIK